MKFWVKKSTHNTSASGTFYNDFDDDMKKLDLQKTKFDKYHAQKIALLGTAHIVRSFLQIV